MHNKLSGRQLRYLRSLGHHLKPLVILGKEGINESVVRAVEAVLTPHELVKVKPGDGFPLEKQAAAAAIAEKTGAHIIRILGKTVLVYRENPELRGGHKIKLSH